MTQGAILRRFTLTVLLSLFVAALAQADCAMPEYEWTLELATLERLEGDADVAAERMALGEQARLRGAHELTLTSEDSAWGGFYFSATEEAP